MSFPNRKTPVGTKLKCTDNISMESFLDVGKVYTLKEKVGQDHRLALIRLKEIPQRCYACRFEELLSQKKTTKNLVAGDKVYYLDKEPEDCWINKSRLCTFVSYRTDADDIYIKEIPGISFLLKYFRLATPADLKNNKPNKPMSQPRLSNGRFTFLFKNNQTGKTAVRVSPTKGIQIVNRGATITNFRNGALYRVVGGPVARYKGQVKGFAVFTVHGKPLAVDVARVRLADKEDVAAYLSDATK